MNTSIRLLSAILAISALSLTSCLKDDDGPDGSGSFDTLELELRQIPDLGLEYFFHMWLEMPNGDILDLGEVEADPGEDYSVSLGLGNQTVENAIRVFATIEPFDDTDPGPSEWKVLEATFNGGTGLIDNAPFITEGSADLASGSYLLATPTTSSNNDEFSGIWFVDNVSGTRMGLDLPTLDDNWIYEGWVNIDGLWLSTGPFDDPNGSDERSNYSSGERPPFPFPGEDFVNGLPGIPVPDLRGKTVYVTIEPKDNVSSPFFLKLMSDEIATDAPPRQAQDLFSLGSGQWLDATITKK